MVIVVRDMIKNNIRKELTKSQQSLLYLKYKKGTKETEQRIELCICVTNSLFKLENIPELYSTSESNKTIENCCKHLSKEKDNESNLKTNNGKERLCRE